MTLCIDCLTRPRFRHSKRCSTCGHARAMNRKRAYSKPKARLSPSQIERRYGYPANRLSVRWNSSGQAHLDRRSTERQA